MLLLLGAERPETRRHVVGVGLAAGAQRIALADRGREALRAEVGECDVGVVRGGEPRRYLLSIFVLGGAALLQGGDDVLLHELRALFRVGGLLRELLRGWLL